MSESSRKADRLVQMEQLLLAHPEGLRRAEIARRLAVHRSTIGRDVDELTSRIPLWEEDCLLGIDRDQYLTQIRLTIHEGMAVHLAARLMATRMDRHNPHAASALRKLGEALRPFAPRVSRHVLMSADVMDSPTQRRDLEYLRVLEIMTRAWAQGCTVRVWHRHVTGVEKEYDFAPYFIEPYAVGQAIHVIGWRSPPGALRTFKIARIRHAELLLDRPYEIPSDFDPRELLEEAWGIWFTDREPVKVVLRFDRSVADRVRETRWHRSETVEDQADGSLLWTARVASWREMVPWIRGWGAHVEVLEPSDLRTELVAESEALGRLYRVN